MNINDLLLDFRITSRCNFNCDLCFRNPGIVDEPLDEIFKVILKMHKLGFRKIGFTGGEPTLREDYIKIISYAKKLGYLTYLSTIGNKFLKDLPNLEGILDWIGLPIDGANPEINSIVRSQLMANQHEIIQNIFVFLMKHRISTKIKLTTVVTRLNLQHLDSMISYVVNLKYPFNVWRFYQFCPLGVGKTKKDILGVSTDEFLNMMKALQLKYSEFPIRGATFEDRDKANILMEPNFDVIIPEGENYTYLCSMKNDSEEAIINAIMNRKDILNKCAVNRYWLYAAQ